MTFSEALKIAEKFTIDNSPSILTAIGVMGTISTAVLTGKAGYKACHILGEEGLDQSFKHNAGRTWKLYIPAAVSGSLTIASVVGANRIGARRAAAVAAAYSLAERGWSEYKDKIVERLGEKKEQGVRDEIAQDRVTANPPAKDVIFAGTGKVLCMDSLTGRYFMSDMEALRKAQNDINHKILTQNYASLTEFYKMIGLAQTPYSEEVGWNLDKLVEITYSAALVEDDKPCIVLNYEYAPIRGYYRLQ